MRQVQRVLAAILCVSVPLGCESATTGPESENDVTPDRDVEEDDVTPDTEPGDDLAEVILTADVPVDVPEDVPPPPPDWCTGKTRALYAPLDGKTLETFPDDFYTAVDAATETGLRVRMDATNAPWLPLIPGSYSAVFEQLGTLDGFGTTAGVILRFSKKIEPFPTGEAASLASTTVRFVDLETGTRVPFESEMTDADKTAILWPMVPLTPKRRYGVVVTREAGAVDGGCIAPSATMKSLLTGEATEPSLSRLIPGYAQLLEVTALLPADVSAATVFTTQSLEESSARIAADIATRDYAWNTPVTCSTSALLRTCEGTFLAEDYRNDGVVAEDGLPVSTNELRVRVWLPLTPGPYPVLFFGHGLGGDKDQGEPLAEAAAPLGLATFAIDAVGHGQHPTSTSDEQLIQILGFFGVEIATQSLNALVLRDNWRQSTFDKLQLLRLLTTGPAANTDFDGDSKSDIDADHFAYFGVSLGGIMGPELLALTDRFGAAILSVPGGRVSTIIRDAAQFSVVITVMKPADAEDGDVRRFFPVLQTLIERGDSANYARFLTGDRIPGTGSAHPQLLVNVVIDDDTVPPGCNRALVRALGVPHVEPVLETVEIIPIAGAAPLSGNADDATVTAGLFQYDRVTRGDGSVERASHGNVARSPEAIQQTSTFLQTWLAAGVAEIVDPYAVLGTPSLPP